MNVARRTGAASLITGLSGALFLAAASPVSAAPPTCEGRTATVVGTNGNDRLVGTSGADVIVALNGHDRVKAMDGNDIVCAGGGNDLVYAGSGHDSVWGQNGADVLYGERGFNTLRGGDGADRLHGGALSETLLGQDGNDLLYGWSGNDRLYGGYGHDRLYGGALDDALRGGGGRDTLFGQTGADQLDGNRGIDHVNGGPDNDWLGTVLASGGRAMTNPSRVRVDLARGEIRAADGVETVTGVEYVAGTRHDGDVLLGDGRRNALMGGPGENDRVVGRGGKDILTAEEAFGGPGDDDLHGLRLQGSYGNDRLVTRAAVPASMVGGPGADTFQVTDDCEPGSDCPASTPRLAGGVGFDEIRVLTSADGFSPREDTYEFDLPAGMVNNISNGVSFSVRDIEGVSGTDGPDTIIGTGVAEILRGFRGPDTISGGGGDDVLFGGYADAYDNEIYDTSSDSLTGGGGTDTCYTSSPPHGSGPPDTIDCEQVSGGPIPQ